MRVIVDAMGGDNAPAAVVQGAVTAHREFGVDIALVGREREILDCLTGAGISTPSEGVCVVNADEIITMEDDPSTATRRKKDSSMSVALALLREGKGDACISAGNTGALLTGATLIVRRIHGIRRACLSPVIPDGGRGVVLIDCGANVDCTPEYLLQFAYMGSIYAREILGCSSPRVGLLNIGAEASKGTQLQLDAYSLLSTAHAENRIHFIGNIESRDTFSGQVDVIVCDGFTGNILLKTVEGTATFLMKKLGEIFRSSTSNKIAEAIVKKDIRKMKALLDAGEVGGTMLMGISKPVIKAHGSSDARAIRSAIKQAIAITNSGIISSIENNIQFMRTINM